VIAAFERQPGGLEMEVVRGGHDHEVGDAILLEQSTVVGEALRRRDAMPFRERLATSRVGLDDADDSRQRRVSVEIGHVGAGPSVAGSDHDAFEHTSPPLVRRL
jgi:hypothetical protein